MDIITGNLIDYFENDKFDIIVHGCNCFNTMGAGLAKQIKNKYPIAYQTDLITLKGDKLKLGTYSICSINKNNICNDNDNVDNNKYIINAYTQYNYGCNKTQCNYYAIRQIFREINNNFEGKTIGIPKIGAGLAGGDWNIIKHIIEEESTNNKIVLVIFG